MAAGGMTPPPREALLSTIGSLITKRYMERVPPCELPPPPLPPPPRKRSAKAKEVKPGSEEEAEMLRQQADAQRRQAYAAGGRRAAVVGSGGVGDPLAVGSLCRCRCVEGEGICGPRCMFGSVDTPVACPPCHPPIAQSASNCHGTVSPATAVAGGLATALVPASSS